MKNVRIALLISGIFLVALVGSFTFYFYFKIVKNILNVVSEQTTTQTKETTAVFENILNRVKQAKELGGFEKFVLEIKEEPGTSTQNLSTSTESSE